MIDAEEKTSTIKWYRSPVEPDVLKSLYQRSDAKAFAQTLGHLGLLALTGTTAFYSAEHWPWWVTLLLVFLHGTFYAFGGPACHELSHDTVFKTKWLNTVFVHVYSFLYCFNYRMYKASHVRHHRSTLHPPDDLEASAWAKFTLKDYLKYNFVNIWGPYHTFRYILGIAQGRFAGEWELKLFPESNPAKRKEASAWARSMLIGHSAILVVSLICHWWMLPVLITLAPYYGNWLSYLCNNTQHVGLQDHVPDYRFCCRTFVPNPFVRFLYWHMNYHTEHHMYAGVPCYNLGKLHRLIKDDLPPCPQGIAAAWYEISAILKKQAEDPTYQHVALIPRPISEQGLSPEKVLTA